MPTSTQNITIEISPWTTRGFTLQWAQIKEELGGNLPTGRASFIFSRDEEQVTMLTNENSGRLLLADNNESGFQFDLPIFITDRQYFKQSLEINFVVVEDSKFFSERISGSYNNIEDAIKSLYKGNVDIRTSSDQNNSQVLHQNCETSLNFIKRLGLSLKSDIVFGYSFEGFLVKDIIGISSQGKDENQFFDLPEVVGGGTGDMTNTTPYEFTYDRKENYPIINPWIDENNTLNKTYEYEVPKNVISVLGSDYYICRAGYENMLNNYLLNSTKQNANFSGNYRLTGSLMPNNYRLGDLIRYRRADDSPYLKDAESYTRCLVYSNQVFMGNGQEVSGPSGFNFQWDTELRCIDDSAEWSKTGNENDSI